MRVYLFGYASDDFVGRVIVTPTERTVAELGRQLVAWGLDARAAWSYHSAQRKRRDPRAG